MQFLSFSPFDFQAISTKELDDKPVDDLNERDETEAHAESEYASQSRNKVCCGHLKRSSVN